MGCGRIIAYAEQLIRKYNVDLTGLVVLTEAASGAYLYNPLIAILAGADRVLTYCKDSGYGRAVDVYKAMRTACREGGIEERYEELPDLRAEYVALADIITNSGHLRPFNGQFIGCMKPTGVIPLMWEPWELRQNEIDLEAARRRGILIMGTNEHEPPCDMRPYSTLTALKLLMDHEAAITGDKILVIGNQATLAIVIAEGFKRFGLECKRLDTHSTAEEFSAALGWASYILVAEHADYRRIIGHDGLIKVSDIVAAGIHAIGVISGSVDEDALDEQGISVFPRRLAAAGYMSYQPSALGPYPVMDLFTGGLKVGEAMARARRRGLSIHDAAMEASAKSPAMVLEGVASWM